MEKWKVVKEFPRYEVSDFGRVRRAGKILKPQPQTEGYFTVALSHGDGRFSRRLIHRLVAIAFIPNPLNLPEVNHTGDSKLDNRASKLEWCSKDEHERDAVRRQQKGDGVFFDSRMNKWRAHYSPTKYKVVYLGSFLTKKAALAARNAVIAA